MATTPTPETEGRQRGIGIAFMSLATVPTLAGGTLMVSALVSRRSREGKPFA
jgi:aryl carrier-like protein